MRSVVTHFSGDHVKIPACKAALTKVNLVGKSGFLFITTVNANIEQFTKKQDSIYSFYREAVLSITYPLALRKRHNESF